MPMQKNVTTYFHTNIFETSSGNFATDLLKFHIGQIGLDRIMYSLDYPFVSRLCKSITLLAVILIHYTSRSIFLRGPLGSIRCLEFWVLWTLKDSRVASQSNFFIWMIKSLIS